MNEKEKKTQPRIAYAKCHDVCVCVYIKQPSCKNITIVNAERRLLESDLRLIIIIILYFCCFKRVTMLFFSFSFVIKTFVATANVRLIKGFV